MVRPQRRAATARKARDGGPHRTPCLSIPRHHRQHSGPTENSRRRSRRSAEGLRKGGEGAGGARVFSCQGASRVLVSTAPHSSQTVQIR